MASASEKEIHENAAKLITTPAVGAQVRYLPIGLDDVLAALKATG